jgi:hypothetical protein
MKRLLILTFLALKIQAQDNHFNWVFGAGPSYFFNDATLSRRIDNAELMGLNYIFNFKGKSLCFNPGAELQLSQYHAKLNNDGLIHVNQYALGLNLDVLMKLSKKVFFRVGIALREVTRSVISVSYRQYNSRSYFGTDEMLKDYRPRDFQPSVSLGLRFPFRLFKREQNFNLKISQFASGLVSSDYWLSKEIAGQDIKVLSAKARPTMLLLIIEINLKKNKKSKESPEEP